MCRSLSEGGRRCPCGGGSRRRAYQRARYANREAAKLITLPPDLATPHIGDVPTPALPSPTEVQPVYRDPQPTRQEALDALGTLRNSLPYHEWQGSPQMKQYVAATITHGAVLRDNTVALIDKSWSEAGVTDEQVAELIRRKREHEGSRAEFRAESDQRWNEWHGFKTLNPGWADDPELKAKAVALGDAYATYHDEWHKIANNINREILLVNKKRRELLIDAVQQTLAAERDIGGEPLLASSVKLSKGDREMIREITGMFPTGMIEYANSRGVPIHARRTKVRAHYIGFTQRKQKVVRAGLLDAGEALRGDKYWHASMDYATLGDEGLTETNFDLGRIKTVENTPDNRSVLEERIATWKLDNPKATKAKTPIISEVKFGDETRLALHIPEAYATFSTRNSPIVSELTFSRPSTLAHEFGHHLEYSNPEVGAACKEFLARRTEGWERVVYQKGRTRARDEVVTPDGFVDSYIGKHYDEPNSTEVFSMGVEALMTGEHGGLLGIDVETREIAGTDGVPKRYKSDPEHFALVMGLLAVANKPSR